MTIIIGIVCKSSTDSAIVMASDSQTSRGTIKRTDTDKISVLDFGSRKVAVAQAGDATMSARAVEILRESFESNPFDDYRAPADLAQLAVAQTKKELFQLNDWNTRPDLGDAFLDNNPFTLMIGYFFPRGKTPEPHLYVLYSVPGFATREYKFATEGCGGTVAQFILERSNVCAMEFPRATLAAIYAVEEVKKVDAMCGGKTKAMVIGPNGVLTTENDLKGYISSAVDTIEQSDDLLRSQWTDLISSVVDRINANRKKKPPEKM